MPENCEATFTLTGDLHARPAGALSVAAAQFSSAVQLAVGGGAEVDAKSVLSVMQLGASSGQEVTVRAVGPDAQEAVDTLIGILSEASKVGDLRWTARRSLFRLGKRVSSGHSFVLGCAVVRRVSVVGNSGSGKSTLATSLAVVLGVPHLELDGVFHQPGWVPLPEDEFRRAVAAAVAGDGWVTDGNYSAVRPLVWARADTVVWLDLPRRTVMRQVVWRTLHRTVTRQELWNGNREPLRNFLTWAPEESVISWAWHNHAKYRDRYGAAAADPANAHLTFVRLTSRRDITRFLGEAER